MNDFELGILILLLLLAGALVWNGCAIRRNAPHDDIPGVEMGYEAWKRENP